ncbi:MAG: hypothetical protein ACFFBH_01400 [Promethearchaeota archaeon]
MGKKKEPIKWYTEFSEDMIKFTEPVMMVKLLGTIDSRGWPHLTVITSNAARGKNLVVWGEMTSGMSNKNIKSNPKQGVFYMTAEMPFKFIQAKIKYTHSRSDGEDLAFFNRSELMRYLTYINIYKAHYNEVYAVSPIRNLPLIGIIKGILKDIIGKRGAKTKLNEKRLNPIGYKLFTNMIGVRAISYVDPSDGYPIIIPCIPLQAADHNRLVFPIGTALKHDLLAIPYQTKLAILASNFDMAYQVVKGTYTGIHRVRGIKFGVVEIEEIYNGSPPIIGKIYPEIEVLPKITEFKL